MERCNSFIVRFLAQKLGELVVLAICLAFLAYIGARTSYAYAWGLYFPEPPSPALALAAGAGAALGFFLFTLYPLMTLGPVALWRTFMGEQAQRFLPAVSAITSVTYVAFWVILLKHPFYPIPFWLITAIMAGFIYWSSLKLYPN